jgi:hypothetical protein
MTRRAGSADLPLHGGHVPKWLADRMTRLGAVISQAVVHHYGRDELLRRLAHPFWFQSFGAVMGMDWHSSGITTSVVGALKRGLAPLSEELGIHVCGGRGQHSRKTPGELMAVGERVGIDGAGLATASRLVAKVDSAAVQDGFDLYLHGFIVSDDGKWVVVQQGMNAERRQARRYHWLSEELTSFVDEPHSAIHGPRQGEIINLTDRRAVASRQAQLTLLGSLAPDEITRKLAALKDDGRRRHRRLPSCHISSCRSTTRWGRVMWWPAVFMALLQPQPSGGRWTTRTCFSPQASERAPCRPSRWSRRWCMGHPTASAIRPASLSLTAARTATPTRCP